MCHRFLDGLVGRSTCGGTTSARSEYDETVDLFCFRYPMSRVVVQDSSASAISLAVWLAVQPMAALPQRVVFAFEAHRVGRVVVQGL